MSRVSLLTLVCVVSLALPAASTEIVLAHYRGVTLGDSVQSVVDRLQMAAADVKVVHERPAMVQELTWRPHRFVSGATVEPDALSEMVMTFHAGRLARIGVVYDRERTQGLTNADMHELMAGVYGTSLLVGTPTLRTIGPPSDRQTIARWEDDETLLLLWREQYPGRLGLTITSIAADAALQEALADGQRLSAAEAPMRDLARRTAEAAAARTLGEKMRLDNKARFKP